MGHATAAGFAETATDTRSLHRAISAHLGSNHYPPIPAGWVEPAVAAIEACVAEEPETEVDITAVCEATGMTPRIADAKDDGDHVSITASGLIEIMHLHTFVEVMSLAARDHEEVDEDEIDEMDAANAGLPWREASAQDVTDHLSGYTVSGRQYRESEHGLEVRG